MVTENARTEKQKKNYLLIFIAENFPHISNIIMSFTIGTSSADFGENVLQSCNFATFQGGTMRNPANKFVWARL